MGAGFSWERSDVIYFLAPVRVQQYLNVTDDSCGKKQINGILVFKKKKNVLETSFQPSLLQPQRIGPKI